MSARIPPVGGDAGARAPVSPPAADYVEASEISASTLDTLDTFHDEQALDKLMGRYEQLSARFDAFADAARADGRRDDEAAAGAARCRNDDGERAATVSRATPSSPHKRARRGRRQTAKAELDGFEGRGGGQPA